MIPNEKLWWIDFVVAAIVVIIVLVLCGCGATSRDGYLRSAATAHFRGCMQIEGHNNPMRAYWCQEDANRFCNQNGLELSCWDAWSR